MAALGPCGPNPALKERGLAGAGNRSLPSAPRGFLFRAVPSFTSHPRRENPRRCAPHLHHHLLARLASAVAAPPQKETRIPLALISEIPDSWEGRQGMNYLPNRET